MKKNNLKDIIIAIIVIGGIAATAICVFSGEGSARPVLTIIGIGIFFLTVAAVMIISSVGSKGEAKAKISGASGNLAQKYAPLLLDERTKQDPDVQRLLQYLEVQKVFFEPSHLNTAAAQSDPNVQELMSVLDGLMSRRAINGDPLPTPNQSPSYMNTGQSAPQNINTNNYPPINAGSGKRPPKNKAMATVGSVLIIIGVALFVLPFGVVFIASALPRGADFIESGGAYLMFGAPPFGVSLIVAGSIIKKLGR